MSLAVSTNVLHCLMANSVNCIFDPLKDIMFMECLQELLRNKFIYFFNFETSLLAMIHFLEFETINNSCEEKNQ